MSRSAVLICPGRGTYNAPELGSLTRLHGQETALLDAFDAARAAAGQDSLRALDTAPRFSLARHTRGDNASALIYAIAGLDARAVLKRFDVVGVTGNSMGWYIALAAASAVSPMAGFEIVNTMGTLMQAHMIGGQTVMPFVDDDWREIPGRRKTLLALVADVDQRPGHVLAVSIHLGGMLVVAGNEAGLAAFEAAVETVGDRYPLRLPNHAAFHTALQAPVAAEGRAALPLPLFSGPKIPLVDGRGVVWYPQATDPAALRSYTLGTQVVAPYDFTTAVQVAARSFAPEVFIVTGPGTTLGSAVAQALIGINWQGLDSKAAFQARQAKDPILLSLGREDQRALALGGLTSAIGPGTAVAKTPPPAAPAG